MKPHYVLFSPDILLETWFHSVYESSPTLPRLHFPWPTPSPDSSLVLLLIPWALCSNHNIWVMCHTPTPLLHCFLCWRDFPSGTCCPHPQERRALMSSLLAVLFLHGTFPFYLQQHVTTSPSMLLYMLLPLIHMLISL